VKLGPQTGYVWFLFFFACSLGAAEKRVVLIAGSASHDPGSHEFRAGCLLLKHCLDPQPGLVVDVYMNGWPADRQAFEGASAVIIYADGGPKHPLLQNGHRAIIAELTRHGVGLGCLHFAVEVPKENGAAELLEWIGGYYEVGYSINPVWTADFKRLPDHPIARGVHPFSLQDEWYFNIRFSSDKKAIVPILTTTPSDKVRLGPYSKRYPDVERALGREEILMWTIERPDTGRGLGFTGGHFHRNWGNDNFRKLVLNGILWLAKMDIPPNGVESIVTDQDLQQNLDAKKQS